MTERFVTDEELFLVPGVEAVKHFASGARCRMTFADAARLDDHARQVRLAQRAEIEKEEVER